MKQELRCANFSWAQIRVAKSVFVCAVSFCTFPFSLLDSFINKERHIANKNYMNNSSVKPPTVMVENIIIWLNSTTGIAPQSNLKLVQQCLSYIMDRTRLLFKVVLSATTVWGLTEERFMFSWFVILSRITVWCLTEERVMSFLFVIFRQLLL
jgi:hypothetical protein